jgi:hypothetical protein
MTELLGVDINSVLADPVVAKETRAKTRELMCSIFQSDAFKMLELRD